MKGIQMKILKYYWMQKINTTFLKLYGNTIWENKYQGLE